MKKEYANLGLQTEHVRSEFCGVIFAGFTRVSQSLMRASLADNLVALLSTTIAAHGGAPRLPGCFGCCCASWQYTARERERVSEKDRAAAKKVDAVSCAINKRIRAHTHNKASQARWGREQTESGFPLLGREHSTQEMRRRISRGEEGGGNTDTDATGTRNGPTATRGFRLQKVIG